MRLLLDGWRIDFGSRAAQKGEVTQTLSPRAIRFLGAFFQAGATTLSRSDLMDRIWSDVIVTDESLTQVVSELRKKLGNRQLIETVSRGGYRLSVPILRDPQLEPTRPSGHLGGISLEAYALCLEAEARFSRSGEGSQQDVARLAAHAARLAPDCALARATYAIALTKRHIYWSDGTTLLHEALDEARAATALQPTLAKGHRAVAMVRLATGNLHDGIAALETALALAPDDPWVHLDAAEMAMSIGRPQIAAALAIRASTLAPTAICSLLLAARVLHLIDPPRSRACADEALLRAKAELSVNTNSPRARYALGPLLAMVGDNRAALAAMDSVERGKTPLEYYRCLGLGLIGDTNGAIETIDFMAAHGWRHACVLEHDPSLKPLANQPGFHRLRSELAAA